MFLCICQPTQGTPYVAFANYEEEGEDEIITRISLSEADAGVQAFAALGMLAVEASDGTPQLELLLTQLLRAGIRIGKEA